MNKNILSFIFLLFLLTPGMAQVVLEDFEEGAQLIWEPLGVESVFGSFDGTIENPDTMGNGSTMVGVYTKGASRFGGLMAELPVGFSLEPFGQMTLQVWAPANTTGLSMKLFSPSLGLKTVKKELPANEKWVDLTFDFSDFANIADFQEIELIFDEETADSGTWYFDNLILGASGADPCEGIEPNPHVVDDFDCQRNIPLTTGSDRIQIINNPVPSGINGSALDRVAEYTDPNDPWSAIVFDYGEKIDLSVFNQLVIKIWSPDVVPLLFKLQGGAGNVAEIFTDVTASEEWVEYVIDFSTFSHLDHSQLAIFTNAGQEPGGEFIYYLDDIEWRRGPYSGCMATFESEALTLDNWNYFQNGSLNGIDFIIVENPDKTGVNNSDHVGVYREAADGGAAWSGMSCRLESTIFFPDPNNQTIRMKVWMDQAAGVVMKVEGSQNEMPGSGDVRQEYTTPGQWQDLTWDFSHISNEGQYGNLTLIMNIDNIPTEDKTYYFDDIVIGDATCEGLSTSLFDVNVESLTIYPNPVRNEVLTIEKAENIHQLVLVNMLGQPVRRFQLRGQAQATVSLNGLEKGIYVLKGYEKNGRLLAKGRVIK